MNLDELRAVQDREREKDSLQHLRDSFYEEVGTYIGDLRAERERRADQADDPFADPEVRRLTDEIETAEEVAESIYERRMGKVVKTASLAAAGYTADTDGLTGEEDDLFDDLVERIEENQETVLDVLSGSVDRSEDPADAAGADLNLDDDTDGAGAPPIDSDGPEAGGAPSDADGPAADADRPTASGSDEPDATDGEPPTPTEPVERSTSEGGAAASGAGSEAGADAGDVAAGGDGERPATEAEAIAAGEDAADDGGFDAAAVMGDTDRITVRITDDVGEIVGVDGTAYDLVTDDVVTLPEENAMPLLEKDAATRVE